MDSKNLRNAALVLLVPLPAILVTWVLFHWFPTDRIPAALPFAEIDTGDPTRVTRHPWSYQTLVIAGYSEGQR